MRTIITITDNAAVIECTKEHATALLFKNPNCSSIVEGDTVILTYEITNLNTLSSLIKTKRKS